MFDIGNRMKDYELLQQDVSPDKWLVVRADGHAFSKLTRGCKKPYDDGISACMSDTAEAVVETFGFDFAYTQSDEITFVKRPLLSKNGQYAPYPFNGRNVKVATIVAGICSAQFTVAFNKLYYSCDLSAYFDTRVINLPDEHEVANCLYWRYLDATRNAILGIARYTFGHKACQGKSTNELRQDINSVYANYPKHFLHGLFLTKDEQMTYDLRDMSHEQHLSIIRTLGKTYESDSTIIR